MEFAKRKIVKDSNLKSSLSLDFKCQTAHLPLLPVTICRARLSRQTQSENLPRDGTLKQVIVLLWTVVAQDIFQHCICKGIKCFWAELQDSQPEQTGGNFAGIAEKRKGRSSNKILCNCLALEKLPIQIGDLSCNSKNSSATARKPVPSLGSWNGIWG